MDLIVSKRPIIIFCALTAIWLTISISLTILLYPEYSSREICLRKSICYENFYLLFKPQIEITKVFGAISALAFAFLAAYSALRNYMSSSKIGVMGNSISHIQFFERFVEAEICRRPRLHPNKINVFSIYSMMFPRGVKNEIYASKEFIEKVNSIKEVVLKSSERYSSKLFDFKFEKHRDEFCQAASGIFIEMNKSPRMEFLETEKEVIELVEMLCRVFGPPKYNESFPERTYK